MTTKGEGKTDAILYAVFLLVCLGSGLLLHILSARSVPGVFKILVGTVFVLSGVITLPGIFKAAVWTVKACRAYRTEYRKLAVVASLVVVVVVASVAVAMITGRLSVHRVVSRPNEPKVGGPPMGRIVSLELAGPLAVGPNGALYVVDDKRHEVLVRLANGQFRVVAGDGRDSFSGDGGPATKAALSDVSDITFGRSGDLYIADGGRVRVVNGAGTIRTIAGDGAYVSEASAANSGSVTNGTPALSASLASLSSIALGRTGELYLATFSQLLRLTPAGKLVTVRAVIPSGPSRGEFIPGDYAHIAVDAHGDVYVGSGSTGWSIYRVAPDGVATDVGYARRSGGSAAVLALGQGGVVEEDNASSIVRIEGDRLVTSYVFNNVPGTDWFTLTYFAVAANGTVYADDIGGGGFQRYQQLVSVVHDHVAVLWQHRNVN